MNKTLIFAVIGLFLLMGCKGEKKAAPSVTFIGGTDSIEFDFLEGAPPAEVYDGGVFPFEVSLNVENKGEYDVAKDDLTITLLGFYPPEFNNPVVSKNADEDLNAAYIDSEGNTIPGAVAYVTFPDFNFLGSLSANNEYTIRADICYKYGTYAQADLCILDDLTALEGKVCAVNENKAVASSSAPIKIENLKENVAGSDKITFSFDITHRGTGAISKLGSSCDSKVANKNKVLISVDTELEGLSCSGLEGGEATTGYVTLYGGKRLIRCTQDVSALSGDFIKKVNIELTYDYKEHKERSILVKHTT